MAKRSCQGGGEGEKEGRDNEQVVAALAAFIAVKSFLVSISSVSIAFSRPPPRMVMTRGEAVLSLRRGMRLYTRRRREK